MPYLYGGSWVDGNSLSDMENSELAVFFGNNPSETRMSGCKAKTLQHARFTRNTRVIIIDPRYTDSMVSVGDEWIPIRPGTDAAPQRGAGLRDDHRRPYRQALPRQIHHRL